MNKYNILMVCGPSSSGKDTLASQLVENDPEKYHKCVLATSRPRRDYEVQGVDYIFDSYQNLFRGKDYVYPITFNGWLYSIPLASLCEDKINIIVSNSYWASALMDSPPKNWDVSYIYLDVPDKVRLIRALNREENPDCKEICRRFLADENDWTYFLAKYKDKVQDFRSLV